MVNRCESNVCVATPLATCGDASSDADTPITDSTTTTEVSSTSDPDSVTANDSETADAPSTTMPDSAPDDTDTTSSECDADFQCQNETLCDGFERCIDHHCEPGEPVVCTPPTNPCRVSTCDPGTGLCEPSAREDGELCDDTDPCTVDDACAEGTCIGTAKSCPPIDDCHQVGVCDGDSGTCSEPVAPDDTTCALADAPQGVCRTGTCVCPGTRGEICGFICVDLDDDPAHCGACDRRCPAGCTVGECDAPAGFVRVEPGTFVMGSPSGELGRESIETQHTVTITRAFWLASKEVTHLEWQTVFGFNPSFHGNCGDACPVEQITWYSAVAFANELSAREGVEPCYDLGGCQGSADQGTLVCDDVDFDGLDCAGYRLPTEAEWEYAARAGTTTAHYAGNLTSVSTDALLATISWYSSNSNQMPHGVGLKTPNAWGLYDMIGNAFEWVHDRRGSYGGSATDPTGPGAGANRVCRGSYFNVSAGTHRAAYRGQNLPSARIGWVGLRVARTAR